MDDKKRLVLKICVRCNYLKFGDVEYDGGFDGIEDLVENSEIEAFFCEDCVMFVKKYAKQANKNKKAFIWFSGIFAGIKHITISFESSGSSR